MLSVVVAPVVDRSTHSLVSHRRSACLRLRRGSAILVQMGALSVSRSRGSAHGVLSLSVVLKNFGISAFCPFSWSPRVTQRPSTRRPSWQGIGTGAHGSPASVVPVPLADPTLPVLLPVLRGVRDSAAEGTPAGLLPGAGRAMGVAQLGGYTHDVMRGAGVDDGGGMGVAKGREWGSGRWVRQGWGCGVGGGSVWGRGVRGRGLGGRSAWRG